MNNLEMPHFIGLYNYSNQTVSVAWSRTFLFLLRARLLMAVEYPFPPDPTIIICMEYERASVGRVQRGTK